MTKVYNNYVVNYMEPYFTQKWMLFAPEPAKSDMKLWYRVKKDGDWSTWLDPLEPVLVKHQQYRFTYNAKLLYVYGNIPKELSLKYEVINMIQKCVPGDQKCLKACNDSLFASDEFQIAKRYVEEDIKSSVPDARFDSLQLMTIQLYPKQFSERLSKKPFGHANSTEYSPVKF